MKNRSSRRFTRTILIDSNKNPSKQSSSSLTATTHSNTNSNSNSNSNSTLIGSSRNGCGRNGCTNREQIQQQQQQQKRNKTTTITFVVTIIALSGTVLINLLSGLTDGRSNHILDYLDRQIDNPKNSNSTSKSKSTSSADLPTNDVDRRMIINRQCKQNTIDTINHTSTSQNQSSLWLRLLTVKRKLQHSIYNTLDSNNNRNSMSNNNNNMSPRIVTELNSIQYFYNYSSIYDFLDIQKVGINTTTSTTNNTTVVGGVVTVGVDDDTILQKYIQTTTTTTTTTTNNQTIVTICEIRNIKFLHHFPHAMQQLFRCWSFWEYIKTNFTKQQRQQQQNDDTNNNNSIQVQPVLVWYNMSHYVKTQYVKYFINVLIKEYKVVVLTSQKQLQQFQLDYWYNTNNTIQLLARAKDTGKWGKGDIEITDYAMTPASAETLRKLFTNQVLKNIQFSNNQLKTNLSFHPGGCHPQHDNNKNNKNVGVTYNPKILLLNRVMPKNTTAPGRSILNINEIQLSIQQNFPTVQCDIIYFEKLTMIQQVQTIMEYDIILSPHGAQLTSIIYMPSPCSQIVELIPYNYLVADFFASLAKASNNIQYHNFFYMHKQLPNYNYRTIPDTTSRKLLSNPEQDNKDDDNNNNNNNSSSNSQPSRKYHYYQSVQYRDDPMCPYVPTVVGTIQSMINEWQTCCMQQKQ